MKTGAKCQVSAPCPATHPRVRLDSGVEGADLQEHFEHALPGDEGVGVAGAQLQVDDLHTTSNHRVSCGYPGTQAPHVSAISSIAVCKLSSLIYSFMTCLRKMLAHSHDSHTAGAVLKQSHQPAAPSPPNDYFGGPCLT